MGFASQLTQQLLSGTADLLVLAGSEVLVRRNLSQILRKVGFAHLQQADDGASSPFSSLMRPVCCSIIIIQYSESHLDSSEPLLQFSLVVCECCCLLAAQLVHDSL